MTEVQLFSPVPRAHPPSAHLCLLPQCPPHAVCASAAPEACLPGKFPLILHSHAPVSPPTPAKLPLEASQCYAGWTLYESSTLFSHGSNKVSLQHPCRSLPSGGDRIFVTCVPVPGALPGTLDICERLHWIL